MPQSMIGLFPSEPADDDWGDLEQWVQVAHSLRGRYPRMTALEAKAMYVFGMMRHLLEAAGWELAHSSYCKEENEPQPLHLTAYQLACGAVDLMGRWAIRDQRCSGNEAALCRGLRKMAGLSSHRIGANPTSDNIVVAVHGHAYTVEECIGIRNFTSHGWADTRPPTDKLVLVPSFIPLFIRLTCAAMDDFYQELRADSEVGIELRKKLAKSDIAPLWCDGNPLHVEAVYRSLTSSRDATPGGKLLHEKSWRDHTAW